MFDAPQRHHTLAFRRTPAERLLRLVRRVHVWIKCSLPPRFLDRCRAEFVGESDEGVPVDSGVRTMGESDESEAIVGIGLVFG
jgi:hypothetical protein